MASDWELAWVSEKNSEARVSQICIKILGLLTAGTPQSDCGSSARPLVLQESES